MHTVKLVALRKLSGDYGVKLEGEMFETDEKTAMELEARGLVERFRHPDSIPKMMPPPENKMYPVPENKGGAQPAPDPDPAPAPRAPAEHRGILRPSRMAERRLRR